MSDANRMADLRCSSFIRAHQVEPIGTAGCYEGFLVLEVPLPWPRDVSEIAGLAKVAAVGKGRNIRLQVAVPERGATPSVTLYLWDKDLGRYVGRESRIASDPVWTALSLLDGRSMPAVRPVEVVDVLVCGHGGRDRCCGKFGVALERELRGVRAFQGGTVRLRRTSHLGGHRFAPTALLLGEGSSWGCLDAKSLTAIVTRRAGVADHLHQYRGCSGLPSPEVQALERAVLGVEGWSLLGCARTGSDLGSDRFALEVEDPARGKRRWEARVLTRRMVPVPKCGKALTGGEKAEPELMVVDLEQVA